MPIFKPDSNHWITLFLTTDCNLVCDYCYNRGRLEKQDLTFKKAKKIIDWFCRQAYADEKGIAFFGGEPLLKIDLIRKIVEYTKTNYPGITYSITTNGTLISRENIDLLREFKFVSVSIDGPKMVHNIHRKFKDGKGSFNLINFNLLKKLKNIHINSVITPQNICYLDRTVMFFIDKFDIGYSFRVAYELNWKEKDIREFRAQMKWFADYFLASYNDIEKRQLFMPIYAFLNTIKGFDRLHFYCAAGRSSFAITPKGEIFPCHRFYPLRMYSLGNVLGKIDLKPVAEKDYFKIKFGGRCINCEFKSLCSLRCPALKKYFLNKKKFCKLIGIIYNVVKYIAKALRSNKEFIKQYGTIFDHLNLSTPLKNTDKNFQERINKIMLIS